MIISSLLVGILALLLFNDSTAHQPVLSVNYYSANTDRIESSHDIIIDASRSFDDDPLDSLFLSVFATGPSCKPSPCIIAHNSSELLLRTSFEKPGIYSLFVTLSDRQWDSLATALTNEELAAPMAKLLFKVYPAQDCFLYRIAKSDDESFEEMPLVLFEGSSTLKVRAWDATDMSTQRSKALSETLNFLGEKLRISFSNNTVFMKGIPQWNKDKSQWEFVVDIARRRKVVSSVSMTVSSSGTNILGCSVGRGRTILSLNPLHSFHVASNISIGSRDVTLRQHPCASSTALLFAPGASTIKVAMTSNFFHTVDIRDLRASACSALSLSSPLCADLRLLDIAYTETKLLVLSNRGAMVASLSDTSMSLQKVPTMRSILEDTVGLFSNATMSIQAQAPCEIPVSGTDNLVAYITITTSVTYPYRHGQRFIAVSYDPSLMRWKLLKQSELCGPLNSQLLAVSPLGLPNHNASVHVCETPTNELRLIMEVSESISLKSSTRLGTIDDHHADNEHSEDLRVFQHRSGIGTLVTSFSSIVSTSNDIFISRRHQIFSEILHLATSSVSSEFAVLLKSGLVLFGRLDSTLLMPCLQIPIRHNAQVLAFDEFGLLWLISFDPVSRSRIDIHRCLRSLWNNYEGISLDFRRERINSLSFSIHPSLPSPTSDTGPTSLLPASSSSTIVQEGPVLSSLGPDDASAKLQQSIRSKWFLEDHHSLKTYTGAKALRFELEVVDSSANGTNCFATSNNVTLRLKGVSGDGWTSNLINMTILVSKSSFSFSERINATYATALVIKAFNPRLASRCMLTAPSGSWSVYDFRSFKDKAAVGLQNLQLLRKSASTVIALLTPGEFSFSNNHIGDLLWLTRSNAFGFVKTFLNSTAIELLVGNPTLRETVSNATLFTSGQWALYTLKPDFDFSSLPSPHNAERSWSIRPPECDRALLGNHRHQSHEYLDVGQSFSVKLLWTSQEREEFLVNFVNLDIVNFIASRQREPLTFGGFADGVELNVSESGNQGVVSVRYSRKRPSLLCRDPIIQTHLIIGCPPHKSIAIQESLTSQEQLTITSAENDISSPIELLPVNYRPPSKYGRAIPITNNIYNADPSQPKHNNVFERSLNSGAFKQCHGKPNRTACSCSDAERVSEFVENSDCIDRAKRVFYRIEYMPEILVLKEGHSTSKLLSEYRLEELNKRTDFCSKRHGCETGDDRYISPVMDPTQNDTIQWHGDELFHFRVHVVSDTYCQLTTEFKVFVFRPPLQAAFDTVIVSTTSIVLGLILLIIYMTHKKSTDSSYSILRSASSLE